MVMLVFEDVPHQLAKVKRLLYACRESEIASTFFPFLMVSKHSLAILLSVTVCIATKKKSVSIPARRTTDTAKNFEFSPART